MMLLPMDLKVYLHCSVTDMRKSINTLAVLVKDQLELEPSSGHFFLFRNRHGDKLKALYYEANSYTLWYRRLEEGKFIFPRNKAGHIELSPEHFSWLLSSNKYMHINDNNTEKYCDFY